MKDFTITSYEYLLKALLKEGYEFQTYAEFVKAPKNKCIILRHDVDAKKQNSYAFAKIQNELGIKGTYYFRTIPQSFDANLMKEMQTMGHEIGYHYETMDTSKGNVEKAYNEFKFHLENFRKYVTVKTICMHGSPMSKFDNRDIWKKYKYNDLGILAEPYFDLDFNSVFYLTDTGRRWDGHNVSVRDKAMNANTINNPDFLNRSYHSTSQIISDLKHHNFPPQVMFTFHPQRWTNHPIEWLKELVLQNAKNSIKRLIVKS
jgi:hypothetical protein